MTMKLLVAAFAMLFVVAAAPDASAQQAGFCKATLCPSSQTRVRIESLTCKATKRRPAIIKSRACCQKPNGKIKCKKYPKCPKNSPSTSCR
jgi:hypothetical protein